jgi:pSer/pThr/pTyr-binding forkhead associated (FHA) protein
MITLKIIEGPVEGEVFEIEKDQIEIGRASDSDVVIADSTISAHHATIKHQNAEYVIEDHSTNGTLVNGKAVQTATLSHEDKIRIGLVTLEVLITSPASGEMTVIQGERTRVEDPRSVGEKNPEAASKKKPSKRFAVYGGAAIVLIAVLIAAVLTTQSKPGSQPPPTTEAKSASARAARETEEVAIVDIENEWKELGEDTLIPDLKEAKYLYDNRELKPQNRYKAMQTWREAEPLLENPASKKRLHDIVSTVDAEISDECRYQEQVAFNALKRKDKQKAGRCIAKVFTLVPETDKRFEKAQKFIIHHKLERYVY